jgi:hypothetical protein
LFAIVYRIKPANLQPLDASVHKELRRSLSNITYYASVMPTCNAEERLRYTGYIEHDLSSLDSLF